MAVELPDEVLRALEGPQFWHLATINPDGSPQVTPVWVMPANGRILVNSILGRKKARNLRGEPRVALSWQNPESPYSNASIQGRVVESYTGDRAEADIDALGEKYLGERPYPWRRPGQQRITFLIEPTHVYHR